MKEPIRLAISTIIRFLVIFVQGFSINEAFKYARFKSSTNRILRKNFDFNSQLLVHVASGNKFDRNYFSFFSNDLQQLNYYASLVKICPVAKEYFILEYLINGMEIQLNIHNKEELALFREVFILKPYSFSIDSKCVLIDVGMNIGFASLFFSTYRNVVDIYSYELICSTFKKAQANFFLNASLSSKIHAFDHGLASSDASISIPFEPEGSLGASIIQPIDTKNTIDSNLINVSVKSISTILTEIVRLRKYPLVIKLDCEGAEYEIVENIEQNNLLQHIYLFMIEWHNKGAESIVKRLRENGFVVFDNVVPAHMPIGFIYAVNLNSINV